MHQLVFEQFATGESVRGPLFISSLALRLVFLSSCAGQIASIPLREGLTRSSFEQNMSLFLYNVFYSTIDSILQTVKQLPA